MLVSFLVIFLFLIGATSDTDDKRNKVLIDIIHQGLERSHFLEVNLDDKFSQKMFSLYMKRLDYSKRFLLKSDFDQLYRFENQLDDQIKQRSYEFFNLSNNIIEQRIGEVEHFYQEILSKPFNFETDETLETDPEKIEYANSSDELKLNWKKYLKYRTLAHLADKIKTQEKAIADNDTSIKIQSFDSLEFASREKVKNTFDNYFRRLKKIEQKDRRSLYLVSFTTTYDPHSVFFPPKDKENFDISMSGQFEGIGATLSEIDGYIKVQRIVPGSASWKQGELEVGDIILKVAQADGEPLDVVDMRLDKAVEFIRGKKGTEVRLTVKKVDASIVVIPIIRDVVILEETYAKSSIINSEKKIGYIKLPKFYADFNKQGSANCTDDMKVEIEKLMDENVEGLILDLRNNGGGSLMDVVKIAGLFIEQGPIVQVKARVGKPIILSDEDSTTMYDAPLIIMVNSHSASASEILAAAMQDYKRAVIIGTSSTFGKGTVQKMINFDHLLPPKLNDIKPLGAMKLTIQKFYRINGGTTQLKGVVPDIVLPDNYKYIEYGEKELDFPMEWTKIEPLEYNTADLNNELKILQKNSKKRIKKSEKFKIADSNAQRLEIQRKNSIRSLNLEKYQKERAKINNEATVYKETMKKPTGLEVFSVPADTFGLATDSAKMDIISAYYENLQKDAYLFEAVSVMQDMIDE